MIEYQWYIVAALMIASYYIGVIRGVKVTTNEVLDIIEKENSNK